MKLLKRRNYEHVTRECDTLSDADICPICKVKYRTLPCLTAFLYLYFTELKTLRWAGRICWRRRYWSVTMQSWVSYGVYHEMARYKKQMPNLLRQCLECKAFCSGIWVWLLLSPCLFHYNLQTINHRKVSFKHTSSKFSIDSLIYKVVWNWIIDS